MSPISSEPPPPSSPRISLDNPYGSFMDTKPPAPPPTTNATTTPSISAPESTAHIPFTFPSNLPTPPFIDISGVPNFRDLGGYPCPPPSNTHTTNPNTKYHVRRNLLYRCAHPTQLTQAGASRLQSLNITSMYDLRSSPELSRLAASPSTVGSHNPYATTSGTIVVPNIKRHFTPVYHDQLYDPVSLARKLKWYTSPNHPTLDYSEGFVMAYRDIATHGGPAYARILRRVLERPDEGLVFHCTAGKDRTGVLGAVILRLCGVEEQVVAWEYSITEPGLGEWRELFIGRMTRTGLGGAGAEEKVSGGVGGSGEGASEGKGQDVDGNGKEPEGQGEAKTIISREEAARICGSRKENMLAFLKVVLEGEFGGPERYLMEVCGLSGQEVDELKRVLVVEVEEGMEVVRPVGIEGWASLLEDGSGGEREGGNGVAQDGEDKSGDGGMGLDTEAGREKEQKVMVG